jgi:hypothetical protein
MSSFPVGAVRAVGHECFSCNAIVRAGYEPVTNCLQTGMQEPYGAFCDGRTFNSIGD